MVDVALFLGHVSGLAAPSDEKTDYKHPPVILHAWRVVQVNVCHDEATFPYS